MKHVHVCHVCHSVLFCLLNSLKRKSIFSVLQASVPVLDCCIIFCIIIIIIMPILNRQLLQNLRRRRCRHVPGLDQDVATLLDHWLYLEEQWKNVRRFESTLTIHLQQDHVFVPNV